MEGENIKQVVCLRTGRNRCKAAALCMRPTLISLINWYTNWCLPSNISLLLIALPMIDVLNIVCTIWATLDCGIWQCASRHARFISTVMMK